MQSASSIQFGLSSLDRFQWILTQSATNWIYRTGGEEFYMEAQQQINQISP